MTTLHRRQSRPYIAQGIDHQGRRDPDDLGCATGIVRAILWAAALWAVGAITLIAIFWGT